MLITEDSKAAIRYDRRLREIAKSLWKQPTRAEYILWQQLKARKLDYKFRRQHALHGYIADFYCYELMLVIEVDGGVHEKRKEHDQNRDRILKNNGYKVMRFTNAQVINNVCFVLEEIKKKFPENI